MVMEIGNLAIVSALHPASALYIYNGRLTLCCGEGKDRHALSCSVKDNDKIRALIAYLNYGKPVPAETKEQIAG